jgi:hypothetical protein
MFGPLVVIHDLNEGYRRRWIFEWKGKEIILQRYHYEIRDGQQYRLVQFFDALDTGGYGDWQWLSEAEVPWDDELLGEVGLALVAKLRIRRPTIV